METNGSDNSVDQQLLQQFRCMGTTDKEELIKQLKVLVGNHIPTASARFLLDMNDWNLQAAVGSYFDIEMPKKVLSMTFIRSDTDSNVFKLPPATPVVKVWTLLNNGDEVWPDGCSLQFCGGDPLCTHQQIPVPKLGPNQCASVTMHLISPKIPGIYKSEWRMLTSAGAYFGEIIWVIMTVEDETSNAVKYVNSTSDNASQAMPQPNLFQL